MTRLFYCITFLVMMAGSAFSQEATELPISKMKKADFMNFIDTSDDSLVAMVNLFFRKRHEAGQIAKGVGIAFPVIVILGTATVIGSSMSSGGDPETAGQGFGIAFAVLFYAAAIPVTVNLIKYSKKKLMMLIDTYRETGTFPDAYQNKLRERDFVHP